MIKLILLLLLLAGGVWVGLSMQHEQQIMLVIAGKSIHMKMWVAIFAVAILFAIGYFLIRFLVGFFNLPSWAKEMQQRRRQKSSVVKTNMGLLALAQGQWKDAQKSLIQGAKGADHPLVNYLGAAKAASEQGLEQKRDEYLALAHEVTDGDDLAVGLTQAQLQLDHGQLEQSLATLKHLRHLSPKHPFVLKLLKTLYIELKDWSNLIELLPALNKSHVMSSEKWQQLERECYLQQTKALAQGDPKILQQHWRSMPKHLNYEPNIATVYAKQMLVSGAVDEAESAIKACLKKQWDEALVTLYGSFKSNHPTKSLSVAESWLKSHPESPGLLLTCGKLAAQNELWGKAQRYLEACLSIDDNLEAYAILGLTYEKMDKPTLSAECFRKGMLSQGARFSTDNLLEHQPAKNNEHLE